MKVKLKILAGTDVSPSNRILANPPSHMITTANQCRPRSVVGQKVLRGLILKATGALGSSSRHKADPKQGH